MQTLSIRFPASVNAEVIRNALQSLGAQIVERVSRKAKPDPEFVGMAYTKYFKSADDAAKSGLDVEQEDGETGGQWLARLEMDGVEVARRIKKMENARLAYNRRDGRDAYKFPQYDAETTAADYVKEFCIANNLRA